MSCIDLVEPPTIHTDSLLADVLSATDELPLLCLFAV